jgi:processive 1,2-diacylglycerol beta-glucosyltransferase
LNPDRPVLLLSSGALGVGPAAEAVLVLRHLRTPAQIVVICGKNEELLAETKRQVVDVPSHLDFRVLGYTDTIDEWMTVADLYIGKPGGVTTAEALCEGLPMMILSPIPGVRRRLQGSPAPARCGPRSGAQGGNVSLPASSETSQ